MPVKPFAESATITDFSEKPLDIYEQLNPLTPGIPQIIVHYGLWIEWLSSLGGADEIYKVICHQLSKEDSASLNSGLMRPLSFGDNFEQILYENIED